MERKVKQKKELEVVVINPLNLKEANQLIDDISKSINDKYSIKNKEKGKYLPNNYVPTDLVIDYLGINMNYLKKVAKERRTNEEVIESQIRTNTINDCISCSNRTLNTYL